MWCCHGRTPGQRVGIKKTTSVTSTIVDGSEIRRSPVDMENIPWFTRVSIMSGGFLAGFLVAINSSNCCMSTNPVNFQLPQVFPLPVSQAPIWMRCPNAPNLLPSWLMQVPQKMAILSMGSSCVTWAKSPLVPVAQLLRPCQVLWRTQEVEKVSNTTKKNDDWNKTKKNKRRWYPKTARRFKKQFLFSQMPKKNSSNSSIASCIVPTGARTLETPEPVGTHRNLEPPSEPREPVGTIKTSNHLLSEPIETWNRGTRFLPRTAPSPPEHIEIYIVQKTHSFLLLGNYYLLLGKSEWGHNSIMGLLSGQKKTVESGG